MADVALRVASTSERAYGDVGEFDVWCAFAATDLRARRHIGPIAVVVEGGSPTPLTGTASATLDSLTGSSAGTVLLAGAASATLGELTGASTGSVLLSGAASVTLGTLTSASAGTVRLAGVAATTLESIASSSAGGVRLAGSSSTTLGALTSDAPGTVTGIPRGLTPAVLSGSSVGRMYRGRRRITRG